MADHFAVARGDAVFALEREARAVAVVRHRTGWRGVPGEAGRIAVRRQVALGQHPAGVGAHQHRTVAPGADEVTVVPAALDHQVGDAEGERAVGAGPHPQPEIGLVGETDMARIDHDQPHAALQRLDDGGRMGEARVAGVVAPQDQTAGVGDVRHGAARAGGDAARRRRCSGSPRRGPSRRRPGC